MPDRVVAEYFDLSTSAVTRLRTRRAIAPYRQHVRTTRYLALLRQYPEGQTTPEITSALGVSRQAVQQILTALAQQGCVQKERQPRQKGFAPIRWRIATGDTPCT